MLRIALTREETLFNRINRAFSSGIDRVKEFVKKVIKSKIVEKTLLSAFLFYLLTTKFTSLVGVLVFFSVLHTIYHFLLKDHSRQN